MPSLLSRFKRSSSTSSDPSANQERSRSGSTSSNAASFTSDEYISATTHSATPSPIRGGSGSHFVENFDNGGSVSSLPVSPLKKGTQDTLTPSAERHRPAPLGVPDSGSKPIIGTPKLVLTEEGSNSPISFSSSSKLSNSPRNRNSISLSLGTSQSMIAASSTSSNASDDIETPRNLEFGHQRYATAPAMSGSEALSAPMGRERSDSSASINGKRSRRGSLVNRVVTKMGGHSSPNLESLMPPESKKKNKRKKRTKSHSLTGGNNIGVALATSGLHIVTPVGLTDDSVSTAQPKRTSNRSPYLVRGDGDSSVRGVEGDDEESRRDFSEDEEEEESDSDLDDSLPVTGFAVASNRRNADFHALFPTVDEGDYLIEDYGCALSKDILVQGRLYVSENHICFHANIFGWVTDVVIPFSEIRLIEKKMTALVIPNAIGVSTVKEKYTFASFISRDTTHDVLMNIWRLCNPNAVMSAVSLTIGGGSRPASVIGESTTGDEVQVVKVSKTAKGHAPTRCACGREGKHYSEVALESTFPSTPEKVYNLMFNSGWFKNFLSEDQKLKDVEMSDWRPVSEASSNLTRSTSYIKPLNGSIGPKQTKCHINDEQDHIDLDDFISMITTTKTPDVPSGGVFSVKTRTCLMWAGANSTKVIVTTTVEWTGKSWVKGIIEKSAIDGQKQYHDDLAAGMRGYMKEHLTEFAGENGVEDEQEIVTKKEEQSEAQAYADKARRERHERDLTYMQGALDSVVSGTKTIFLGLKALVESISDFMSDTPLGKEAIMGGVILVLLLSNIYTYYAYSSSSKAAERRARRLGASSGDEMAEAMRLFLQNAGQIRPMGDVKGEAAELQRVLDQVEERVLKLRQSVKSAVGGAVLE